MSGIKAGGSGGLVGVSFHIRHERDTEEGEIWRAKFSFWFLSSYSIEPYSAYRGHTRRKRWITENHSRTIIVNMAGTTFVIAKLCLHISRIFCRYNINRTPPLHNHVNNEKRVCLIIINLYWGIIKRRIRQWTDIFPRVCILAVYSFSKLCMW